MRGNKKKKEKKVSKYNYLQKNRTIYNYLQKNTTIYNYLQKNTTFNKLQPTIQKPWCYAQYTHTQTHARTHTHTLRRKRQGFICSLSLPTQDRKSPRLN